VRPTFTRISMSHTGRVTESVKITGSGLTPANSIKGRSFGVEWPWTVTVLWLVLYGRTVQLNGSGKAYAVELSTH
jgi:hypothetical protein